MKDFHLLIIVADGQGNAKSFFKKSIADRLIIKVTPDGEWCKAETLTREAIVEASNYPLSIIVIGVGDGPWDTMQEVMNTRLLLSLTLCI